MVFALHEIVDIVGMTLFLGILFADMFRRPKITEDFEGVPRIESYSRFNMEDIAYAALILAPGIVLHELAHKFTAIALGNNATFYAFYRNPSLRWLGIFALILKFAGVNFFFLVPGFVAHSVTDPVSSAIISISGPLVHLIFWLVPMAILRSDRLKKAIFRKKRLSDNVSNILFQTSRINQFLFIFNMLPIPFLGTDGYQFLRDIIIIATAAFA